MAHGQIENLPGDLVMIDAGGVEAKVRRGFVDGSAGLQERVKDLSRVFVLKQRAASAANGPFEKDLGLGIEPDDDADFF